MNRYDYQRKAIASAARRFESECSGHVMTIKHDDGLYRHLRFVAAEGYSYWFDLITWPGNLTFNGDMGTFTFARVEDMFTFFRGKDANPQYWAEKVRGETEVKAYSETVLRAELEEPLADHEREYMNLLTRYFERKATFDALPQNERWPFAARGMREPVEPKTADEVRELIADYDDDGQLSHENGARDLLAELEKAEVVSDTGEWSLSEYTVFYLYACHAIVWGIGQYDAAKSEPEASATQPMPAEVLTGEVTSPYGPCSGLAPDKRDNTCTNFAAEYVEHECTVAGLTVGDVFTPATRLSRLCTPCADVAPGLVSRRPLTTTPGGYPVERA